MGSAIAAATLSLLATGPSLAVAAAPALPPADLARLLEQARRVQEADVAAWAEYRFVRIELRQRLDESGRPVQTERVRSLVTPIPGGFDERLIEIDGRAPAEREVEKHGAEGRFARRYARMRRGEGDPDEGGYSLGFLLRMASYRHAGTETVDGVACHRLDFSPGEARDNSLAARFAEAMAGTIWLTLDGLHIARASARSVSPVSVALIVVRLQDLQVNLQSAPVGEGRWLPRRIELIARSRVMGFPLRKRNVYEYVDFVSAIPAPKPPPSPR